MKHLSPADIEELLETHEPQALLAMYQDRLDSQGRQILENARSEEAQAEARLKAMSIEFRDGLPPAPQNPWPETMPPVIGRRSLRKFHVWSAIAAVVVLSLLSVWVVSQRRGFTISQTRQILSPAEFEQTRRQLNAAWVQLARALLKKADEVPAEDQTHLHRLAIFYLDSVSSLGSNDPSQQVEAELLRNSLSIPSPPSQTEPLRFDTRPPLARIEVARNLHRSVPIQDSDSQDPRHALTAAYLAMADHFTTKARLENSRRRASIANQWASYFLDLANIAEPDQAETLIRLIRVKELLGESAEANALTDRLNGILNQD